MELYRRRVKARRHQTEQFGKLAKPLTFQDVINGETITPSIIEETAPLGPFSTKEGHQILFTHQQGTWRAMVKEEWPGGFSRQLNLPVYLEPGLTIEDIAKHSPAWQKHYIQIIFPEQLSNREGYVYIGRGGLLGGGNETSKGSPSRGREHAGSGRSHASSKSSSNKTSSSSQPSSSNKPSSGGNTSTNSTTHTTIPHAVKDTPRPMSRGVEAYIERAAESSKENSSSSSKSSTKSKSSGETRGTSQAYLKEVNKMGDKLDRAVLGMTMGWQDRPTASTSFHDTATSSKPETSQKTSVSSTPRSTTVVDPKDRERVSSQQQTKSTTKPKEMIAPREDKPTVSSTSSSTRSYPTNSSPRSRSPRRHSPTRRSSSPARSTWESEQRREAQERPAKQQQAEGERKEREAPTQKEWEQLVNEMQNKWGHTKINSLPEGTTKKDQIKADIARVKSYKQYTFLDKETIEQVVRKLEKSYRQVKEQMREPKARAIQEDFNKMVSEIEQRIQNIEAQEMPMGTTSNFNKVKAAVEKVKENMREAESSKQSSQNKLPAAQEAFEKARTNAFKFGRAPYENDQGELVPDQYFDIADKAKEKLNVLENNIDACNYFFKCYLSDLKKAEKELTAIEKVLKEQKEKLKGEKEEKKQNKKEKDYDLPGGEKIPHSIQLDNRKTINIDFGHSKDGISADHAVNPKLVAALKIFLNIASKSCDFHTIYISTTTNGEHEPDSNHYVKKASALDIACIDGQKIVELGSQDPRVIAFQNALEQLSNINENFGPALFLKLREPYLHDKLTPKTYAKRQNTRNKHFNHIHFSVTP